MKIKKPIFFIILGIIGTCCFADRKINFSAGLGSCVPFYSNSAITSRNSTLLSNNYSRMILDVDSSCSLNLSDNVFFVLGIDSVMDFFWYGSNHCNYLDYDFLCGIKFLPGIGGLSASVNYLLGRRTDFVKIEDEGDYISNTAWGNGFEFEVAYDFSFGTSGWAPILCFNWKRMPRGSASVDNIIGITCRFPIF